jgi:hypothetical protein
MAKIPTPEKDAGALKDVTNVDKGKKRQETVFEMVKRPAT